MANDRLSVREVCQLKRKMSSERQTFETHWQEIYDYIIPRKNNVTVEYARGQKRNVRVYDNTGMHSNELLAGALHGLMTNPNSLWFGLTTGDSELDTDQEVASWLQDSVQRMHDTLNNTNFQTEIHEFYLDLCSICTAVMTMEEDDESLVYFKTRHISNAFISENQKGFVDRVIRCFKLTAEEVIREFGEGLEGPELEAKVGKKVVDAFKRRNADAEEEKFSILHAVYRKPLNSKKKFPWVSQYVIEDNEAEIELKVRGFRQMPYIVGRWAKASDEVYGRGPGFTALPEIKTVNKMIETTIRAAQKAMDPPLQVPDDGFVLPIKTRPGSMNFRRGDANPNDEIRPIYNQDIRIDFGQQIMEDHRRRVREAFFVDQLQLNQGPQMTATEVMQRTEEKMRLLGPLLGRQNHEVLRPMIDRLFQIMLRKEMFLPVPEVLAASGAQLGVKYTSMIARTQKMQDGQNILRTIEMLAPFIEMDPSIRDNISGDDIFKVVAEINNFPQKAVTPDRRKRQIREDRAEQQQKQQQQEEQAAQAEAFGKAGPAAAMLSQGG